MKGTIGRATLLLLVASLLLPFSPATVSNTRDDGGSAPYLLGDIQVVAIFVSTPIYTLSQSDINEGTIRLERALDWLEDQSPYRLTFTTTILNSSADKISFLAMEEISHELFSRSLTEVAKSGLKRYDGYAFLFITGEGGRSYAMPYDPDICYDSRFPSKSFWGERAVIYMKTRSGTLKDPATYAHELLHLFGARDKYNELWKGQKLFPLKELEDVWFEGGSGEDIMSSVSSLSFIDEITRGEIGWGDVDGDGIPDPLDIKLG